MEGSNITFELPNIKTYHYPITEYVSIKNTLLPINPLAMPLCDESVTYCQNFDFKIRRDHQKISYERRDYESVDEKSLS